MKEGSGIEEDQAYRGCASKVCPYIYLGEPHVKSQTQHRPVSDLLIRTPDLACVTLTP